jgi:branched-chain amino acid aminotransferase
MQSNDNEYAYINGEYVLHKDAKISIFDTGVMRGDTVTESIRTFHHKPYRLREHINRLFKSMKVVRYPQFTTPAELEEITMQVVEKNRPAYTAKQDFWIVHNITRGPADLANDPSRRTSGPTVIIFTSVLDLSYWASFYVEGCHAVTPFSRAIPSQSLDPKIKNRSRLSYTLPDLEVKLVDPRAQCVLLDDHGNIGENKGGNFFIVADGVVKTPTTRNVLAGLSRKTVLELCEELEIPSSEQDLQPYDVYTADEAFFTSTPYCIMPATRFNGLAVGDGKVGPITRRLLKAWSERVGLDIVAQALNP